MLIIIFDYGKCLKYEFQTSFQYYCFTIDNQTIHLEEDYEFIDKTKEAKLELKHYSIECISSARNIQIYLYKDAKGINTFHFYCLQPFILSTNPKSNLINLDSYSSDQYLVFRDKALETNSNLVYLNSKPYKGEKCKTGDRIEFLGFVFYIGVDFLYINDFLNENKIKQFSLKENIPIYDDKKPYLHNYYEEELKPFVTQKIKHFDGNNHLAERKLLFQLGPALTMAMGMCILAYVNINGGYNKSSAQIVATLIMPIVMIISSFIWPLIAGVVEKKKNKKEYQKRKNQYLIYLDSYEKDLNEKRKSYYRILHHYAFDEHLIEKRWFYINRNSKEFLKITLGLKNDIYELDYSITNDNDINQRLVALKEKCELNNVPFFLDLKENKRVTFISSYNSFYLFNRILLELVYKYSYQDVLIVIYCKDKKTYREIYHIPHLFYQGIRFTFIKEKELLQLNELPKEKEVVLLLLDNIDIHLNENIHVLYFSSSNKQILKDCNAIIEYREEGVLNNQIHFQYEFNPIDFKYYYDKLSSFLCDEKKKESFNLMELVKEDSILNNYKRPPISLEANFAIHNDEILNFDLHESKDGPHGLIGGSTGSGKTEAIVSLLLSLAIQYRSDYLNIILIDYKGGGIKESLSINGICLPHIVADISNLESDSFERLMESIDSECKRRLLLFKSLSNASNGSIMNVDEYLKKHKSYYFERLAHLLIVVDEFAELKASHPDVIKKLISFSRIGRSLGLHLILATQKPSGIIDEEIWSNSHFKIALKMHNEKDSYDVIKSKDAAYLTSPGEFILKEENSEIHARAIYTKTPINNFKRYEVALLDHSLHKIKTANKEEGENTPYINYCLKKILEAHELLNIQTKKFHFDKPRQKTVLELREIYEDKENLVLGEIDDYYRAYNNILSISFFDNVFLYSNNDKSLNTLLNQYNAFGYPSIVLSSKRIVGGSIKDCILYEEEEDIRFLFASLFKNKERITIFIEDLNTFLSYDDNYLNQLYILLKRSSILNINFILLSKVSNINFKILNCFKSRFIVNAYDSQDITNVFGMKSHYISKSYFFHETPIPFVETLPEDYCFMSQHVSSYLKHIPDKIVYESGLLGIDTQTREKVYLSNEKLIICGYDKALLKKYKKLYQAYTNVEVYLYTSSLLNTSFNILWVGEGAKNQRIFYLMPSEEIKPHYIYYYSKGTVKTLKGVELE